jgi:hypothetical protein
VKIGNNGKDLTEVTKQNVEKIFRDRHNNTLVNPCLLNLLRGASNFGKIWCAKLAT